MEQGEPREDISRRRMLRRIGAGAAVAWTVPVLTSIRTPAFAATAPSCDWSTCVGLCAAQNVNGKCHGEPPGRFCQKACSDLCGGHPPHECTCPGACNPSFWVSGCDFIGHC
jgi:hypothetical protein